MENKKKTYVLDTTVLIDNSDIIYEVGKIGDEIVIPISVIKEIDGLKKNPNEMLARAARAVADELGKLGEYLDLAEGGQLRTGAILKIETRYEEIVALASAADNKIVGTAIKLKKEGRNVILLSTDNNMRTAARAYGVKAELGMGYRDAGMSNFKENGKKINVPQEENTDWFSMLTPMGRDKEIMKKKNNSKKELLKECFFLALGIGAIWALFTGYGMLLLGGAFIWLPLYAIYLHFKLKKMGVKGFKGEYKHRMDSDEDDLFKEDIFTDPVFRDMPGNIFHD